MIFLLFADLKVLRGVSLWSEISAFWFLMALYNFSCVYWPFQISHLGNASSYLLPSLVTHLWVKHFLSTRHEVKGFHIDDLINHHKLLPWIFSFARELYVLISFFCCIRYLSIEWKRKKHACKFPNLLAKHYASRLNTFILGMTLILALFHKYYLKVALVLSVTVHQILLHLGKGILRQ